MNTSSNGVPSWAPVFIAVMFVLTFSDLRRQLRKARVTPLTRFMRPGKIRPNPQSKIGIHGGRN